jgi:dTDP-glucose pyrophosphorylase
MAGIHEILIISTTYTNFKKKLLGDGASIGVVQLASRLF